MADKNISVKINAKDYASDIIDKAKSKAESLPKEEVVVLKAKDEITSTVDGIKGKLSGIGGAGFMSGVIGGFVGGISGTLINQTLQSIGQVVASAKKSFVDYNATMEQTRIAFESMLGSAKDAKAMLAELKTFAAKTPFEFEDIAPAAQQLKAFGFEAADILPTLAAIGNASSGLGKGTEGLKQMAFVFGQIKTTGRLLGGDVMQLSQLGVPVKDILAKNLGLAADEMSEIGRLGIDADTAIRALTQGMNERFPDMMKKQSESFNGLISTIQDNTSQLLGKLGEPIFDSVKEATQNIATMLDKMLENVDQKGLSSIFDDIIPDKLAGNLRHLFDSLEQGWEQFKVILGNIGDTLAAIFKPALNNADYELILDWFDTIASGALNTSVVISSVVADVAEIFSGVLEVIYKFTSDAQTSFQNFYAGTLRGLVNLVNKYLKAVWEWLTKALNYVGEFVDAALDKLGIVGEAIRRIGAAMGKSIGGATEWISKSRTVKALSNPVLIDGSSVLSGVGDTGGGFSGNPAALHKSGGTRSKSGGSGGGSVGDRLAKKIQDDYKKALDKIKEMAADVAEKIASLTETKEQASLRKLEKERVKYFNDIRKYQDAINAAQTEQEKAENARKIAALTEQWKAYEAARKKEISREADKTGYELEMQHIQNLMDMRQISAVQQVALQNRVLESRRAQLEQLLQDETLNAEKRAAVEKQLAEVIKQAHQNAAYDMKTGWIQGLREIANQQIDFKQAAKSLFQGIENSITNFLTSTESMNKRVKNLFKDLANAVIQEISRIIAKALVAQMVTGLFGNFGSKSTLGSSNAIVVSAGGSNKWFDRIAGYRANGGPVTAGRAYIVGERRPEVFVPERNGKIIQTNELGGGTPKINIIIHNESGQQMNANAETKFDGEEWITNVFIKNITTNKSGTLDILKGAMAR